MTMIIFAILILLVIQIVMYVVLDRLSHTHDMIIGMIDKMTEAHNVAFQATQVLKERIDAVCVVAESNADKCDLLTQKAEVAEIQILNLNNKAAQHNTAIQKLQDSCIEVK
jgi:uncharacterized membrane protein YcgQ (UPF0703/DUF1980 family)